MQVLDAVASGGSEAADILRKQSVVDKVIECNDIAKGETEIGDGGNAEAASGAPAQQTSDKPVTTYVPDPAVRESISATIVSLFSKLVTPEEVTEAISLVCSYAEVVATSTGHLADGRAARTDAIILEGVVPGALVGAVRRLGLMADTGEMCDYCIHFLHHALLQQAIA